MTAGTQASHGDGGRRPGGLHWSGPSHRRRIGWQIEFVAGAFSQSAGAVQRGGGILQDRSQPRLRNYEEMIEAERKGRMPSTLSRSSRPIIFILPSPKRP